MANKPTQPVFPLGLAAEEQSTLAGVVNTGTIEHGPDAVLTLPEGNASAGLPSSVRYNADSDEFEGFYENGGWLPLGGGGIRWEVLPHASTVTLTEGRGYLINNTTGASTVVLPSPTRIGNSVTICDAYGKFATYPLTVSPSGNNLYGSTEDMTITTDNVSATFTWSGPEQGWIITSGVGLGQGRVYSREIFTKILASETSAVALNTPPTIVDVYADGKRLAESKYSLDGNVITFSPSLPANTELQVIEYTPIQLGNVGGSGSSTITWVYNGGSAIGGETEITLDVVVDDVPAIDINGSRQYKNLGFTFDPLTSKITLAQELEPEDEVVVIINGTPNIYNQIDHTLREVARAANVKDSEVILSSDTTQSLNGKKIIYSVSEQKAYGLPVLPTNVYVQTVANGKLTYNPGNITVDLELAPNSIQNIYDKLDSVDGAGIVNTTKGFTVQELLDVTTIGYYPGMDTISTPLLADKTALTVYKPLTVVDSDSQGAKVISDTSIVGVFPNKNPIKTTGATQSALRLAGSNITLKQLRGEGVATSSNTATSEFITSRMASHVDGITVRGLIVDDIFVTGFTSGIAISGMENAIFNNIRGENLKYSPTGLNSAGGYLFVFGGNTSKNITISNVHHKLIPGADRHTLYISAEGTEVGWENVLCENINCDWSANSVTNVGVNNSPFAMSPINVRTGNGLVINNYTVRGYVGSIVSLLNERGPITNVVMNNMVALECQSFQNGSIMEIGSIVVGNGQYTPRNSNITISNCNTRISRGVDNNGARMPAGSDIGVSGGNVDFLNIIDSQFTTESGPAIKLTGCNDVLIDNINDNMTDVTSGINSIVLTNCNRVTIGKLRSNRAPTGTKERVYTLTNCSDVTCLFPRRVSIYIKGTVITVNEDRWNILNGVPTVNGNTINVPVLGHLTANAKRTCAVINNTLGNITAIRVADVDINTLRIGFWDTSTNAISPIGSVDNLVYIDFYC